MWDRTFLGVVSAVGLAFLGTSASADTVFGSKLNHQLTGPEICNSDASNHICTWVITTAQGNGALEQAPHDGTIKKLRLLACGPGTFILQIARAQPGVHKAQVVRTGPLINYVGNNQRNCINSDNFLVEVFTVNVPVKQGDYLAVAATKVNFNYSSGDREDVFDPALPDGGPLRTTTNEGLGSGLLMLQAVMDP
jgi:hypothetical protein